MQKQMCVLVCFFLMGAVCLPAAGQDRSPLVNALLDSVEQGQPQLSAGQKKIQETVSVLDAAGEPLENVLDMITNRTGVVFVIPEAVKGKVSLFIENVNVWDLLKIILQEQGLAFYRTNDTAHVIRKEVFLERYGYDFPLSFSSAIVPVRYAEMEPLITRVKVQKSPEGKIWVDVKNRQIILIDTPEKIGELKALIAANDVYLVTKEFSLKYVSYETIRNGLTRLLTKDIGRLEYRESEKKVVVTDAQAAVDAAAVFLEENDRKIIVPFRVKIMRASLSEEHAQGIDWEAIVSDYQMRVLEVADQSVPVSEQIHLGTVTREDYEILIDALDTVGDLIPLMAFDFEPVLDQDRALDLDTNDPFWSMRPGVKKEQDGPVILDPNGFEMKMSFMLKRGSSQLQLEILPRLHWMDDDAIDEQKRRIFTSKDRIRVDFSRSDVIVIGGLIRTDEISRTRKFPILGDLPVVGSVFRMERRRYTSTEYMLFLIPSDS